MKQVVKWRPLPTFGVLSVFTGLAIAKHTYMFDELAWTKKGWSDLKLRFPIENLSNEDGFGSYEHLSSQGTHSKTSLQRILEEGNSLSRYACNSMCLCRTTATRLTTSSVPIKPL